MRRILFVGPLTGYTSYPVVCKGLLRALTSVGFEVDVADTTWDGSPDHTAPFLLEENRKVKFLERMEVASIVQQGTALDEQGGLCIAVNPTHHLMGIKDNGYKVAGMFVGDVDSIPGAWKTVMEQQDVILTPSSWGRQVIEKSGINRPVMVLNHGIDPEFAAPKDPVALDQEPFVFLHCCSAIYFPERKGTPQALRAFSELIKAKNVGGDFILRLILGGKTKPIRELLNRLDQDVLEHIQIIFREGAREPSEIRQSYLMSHVGLYPSRAEGMGMMPIEQRACGVPVIQTLCTGHFDHLDDNIDPRSWGVEKIAHGEMIEAWGKFGKAPMVRWEHVYDAMLNCLTFYDDLRHNAIDKAEAVRANWSWEETTRPLIDWIDAIS